MFKNYLEMHSEEEVTNAVEDNKNLKCLRQTDGKRKIISMTNSEGKESINKDEM